MSYISCPLSLEELARHSITIARGKTVGLLAE